MATVEQRGDSTRVNWRLGGVRTGARQSCTFRGPTKARAKLAAAAKSLVESRDHGLTRSEVYDAVLGKPDEDTRVPTFKQWVDMWVEDRSRMRDVQPDVIKSYHRILTSRAVPYLGHLRLTQIDHETLRNWVAWMSSSRITIGSKNRRTGDRVLSAATIRRCHAIAHACLGAAAPKWVPTNPAARPPGSKAHVTGLPKHVQFEGMFLTPDEFHLIKDHCDPHIRDMVIIAVRSGLRLGELIALEAQHVTFSQTNGKATIHVRKARKNDGTVGEPKSKASRRDVTIGLGEPTDILRARTQCKKPRALVFPSPKGGMWDEGNLRDRYWYRSVAAAMRCTEHPPPLPKKPVHGPRRQWRHDEVSTCDCTTRLHRRPRFHDLRHTHASLLIADGMHAKKIQLRLGHADYNTTTGTYSHLLDLGNDDELAALETRIGSSALVDAPVMPRPRPARSVDRRGRRVRGRRLLARRGATPSVSSSSR